MKFLNISDENRQSVTTFISNHWYTTEMILRGQVIDMTKVDGIVAMENGEIVGLVTFSFYGDTCEILSLDSVIHSKGIGSALIEKTASAARQNGCRRIVLITTNDNIEALYFYQRRGFDMARINRNALDISRKLKPEIPLVGEHGIPLRHEIEFEMEL